MSQKFTLNLPLQRGGRICAKGFELQNILSNNFADKKVFAYLLQDTNVQREVFDTLSPKEQRTLLAKFIGEEKANKIDRDSLDSMLLKETKKMVDKDTVALATQSNKNKKAQDIVNNATNLIAEFKHLPTNERGIVKKDGQTVYYNKKTKNALVIERDKNNNIISIRTVSNYNPSTGKITPIIKFTPDKILCNLDGQKGTYEWHSQFGDFNKLKEYVTTIK